VGLVQVEIRPPIPQNRWIDDTFTPETGIPVSVELVNMNILLAATLAGKGPDVALGVDPALPNELWA